jgi:hypothetical protein
MWISFTPNTNELLAVDVLFVNRAGSKYFPGSEIFNFKNFFGLTHDITLCCILTNKDCAVNKKRTQVRFICSFVGAGILYATTIDIGANILLMYKAALGGPRVLYNFLTR